MPKRAGTTADLNGRRKRRLLTDTCKKRGAASGCPEVGEEKAVGGKDSQETGERASERERNRDHSGLSGSLSRKGGMRNGRTATSDSFPPSLSVSHSLSLSLSSVPLRALQISASVRSSKGLSSGRSLVSGITCDSNDRSAVCESECMVQPPNNRSNIVPI